MTLYQQDISPELRILLFWSVRDIITNPDFPGDYFKQIDAIRQKWPILSRHSLRGMISEELDLAYFVLLHDGAGLFDNFAPFDPVIHAALAHFFQISLKQVELSYHWAKQHFPTHPGYRSAHYIPTSGWMTPVPISDPAFATLIQESLTRNNDPYKDTVIEH